MVFVFDLDDTLYEELSFVRSGFRAVADYLSPLIGLPQSQIVEALNAELQLQREQVFDRFLLKQGIKSQKMIKSCVSVYRGHEPSISLFPEARACLARLQEHPIYIVTDGNQLVQRKKFLALGLDLLVRRCFFTYAHGLHRRKPSPYCFEKICQIEQVSPSSVVYIGDNPHKDFVGIKPLGFQTVRVLTGPYRYDQVDEVYEAHFTIPNLQAFNEQLIQQLQIFGQTKGKNL
jgi:putative hydrolase of the HAD superfamily